MHRGVPGPYHFLVAVGARLLIGFGYAWLVGRRARNRASGGVVLEDGWLYGLPCGKGKRGVYDSLRISGVPGGAAAAVLGSAVIGTQATAQAVLAS